MTRPHDRNRWEILSDRDRWILNTVRYNQGNQWVLHNFEEDMIISTPYLDDPSIWEVVDYLPEKFSVPSKIAMLFVAILHSIPG